jgi:excinuclease UvrABC helicase subunit UvrB
MVKFSRDAVLSWLVAMGYARDSEKFVEVTFKISGKVNDTLFEGYATVRVPVKE